MMKFKGLLKKLGTKENISKFLDMMLVKTTNGTAITDNALHDGLITGLLWSNGNIIRYLLSNPIMAPACTDSERQMCEIIITYLLNNEAILSKEFNKYLEEVKKEENNEISLYINGVKTKMPPEYEKNIKFNNEKI